jgi:hypothetical protein
MRFLSRVFRFGAKVEVKATKMLPSVWPILVDNWEKSKACDAILGPVRMMAEETLPGAG